MPKTKISITVDASVLQQADRLAGETTRSKVIEEALAAWVRTRRRDALEKDIEAYYLSLAAEEREEDARWASLGGRHIGKTWR